MVTALLTALAILSWPTGTAAARLRTIAGNPRSKRSRIPRPNAAATATAAAATGWLIADAGGAASAALLAMTARRQLRTRAHTRTALTALDAMAEALHALVTALRAGAHPARAAELAAQDAPPDTAAAMRAIAAATSLNGDLTSVQGPALTHVAAAWQLAHRHGLPLAEVLDATRHDLRQRARFTRQTLAKMTGPRSSALALAFLPLMGIAMGEAVNANPLHVLTNTTPGQALLVAGTALLCAGVTWSAHITNKVITP